MKDGKAAQVKDGKAAPSKDQPGRRIVPKNRLQSLLGDFFGTHSSNGKQTVNSWP